MNDGKKHSNTWTNSGRQILVRRRTISTDSHLCFCFILAPGFLQPFPFFFSSPLSPILCLSLCFFFVFFFIKHSASFGGIKRGEVAGKGDEDEKKNNKFSSLSFSCSADSLTIVMFFFTSSILYVFSRVGLFTSCPAPLSPTSGGRLRIQTHQLNSRGL